MSMLHNTQTLISEFQSLQLSARTFADIEGWVLGHSELLCAVTNDLLGKKPTDKSQTPPCVRKFEFEEFDGIDHDLSGLPYVDEISRFYHLKLVCNYKTDPTINLDLVFRSIPELGVMLDPKDSVSSTDNEVLTMVLSPKYWPIATSYLLFNIGHERDSDIKFLNKLNEEVLPSLSMDAFIKLYEADLFADEATLCEWLLRTTIKNDISNTDLPTNIIS